MDGWMDGCMDGWMDGYAVVQCQDLLQLDGTSDIRCAQ